MDKQCKVPRTWRPRDSLQNCYYCCPIHPAIHLLPPLSLHSGLLEPIAATLERKRGKTWTSHQFIVGPLPLLLPILQLQQYVVCYVVVFFYYKILSFIFTVLCSRVKDSIMLILKKIWISILWLWLLHVPPRSPGWGFANSSISSWLTCPRFIGWSEQQLRGSFGENDLMQTIRRSLHCCSFFVVAHCLTRRHCYNQTMARAQQ